MSYKIASIILLFFALFGGVINIVTDFDNRYILLLSLVVYVCIPFIGAISCWKKLAPGMVLAVIFFAFLSVRTTSNMSILPHMSAFSIAYPIGNFSEGKGYLIDFFAIFMALFVSYLSKRIVIKSK